MNMAILNKFRTAYKTHVLSKLQEQNLKFENMSLQSYGDDEKLGNAALFEKELQGILCLLQSHFEPKQNESVVLPMPKSRQSINLYKSAIIPPSFKFK